MIKKWSVLPSELVTRKIEEKQIFFFYFHGQNPCQNGLKSTISQ